MVVQKRVKATVVNAEDRTGKKAQSFQKGNPAFQSNSTVGSRRRVENHQAQYTWRNRSRRGLDEPEIEPHPIVGARGEYNRNNIQSVIQQGGLAGPENTFVRPRNPRVAKIKNKSKKAMEGAMQRNNWIIYVKLVKNIYANFVRLTQPAKKFPELMADNLLQAMFHAKDSDGNDCPVPPTHYIVFADCETRKKFEAIEINIPSSIVNGVKDINIFDETAPIINDAPYGGRNARSFINELFDNIVSNGLNDELVMGAHYWPYRYTDNSTNNQIANGISRDEWYSRNRQQPQVLQYSRSRVLTYQSPLRSAADDAVPLVTTPRRETPTNYDSTGTFTPTNINSYIPTFVTLPPLQELGRISNSNFSTPQSMVDGTQSRSTAKSGSEDADNYGFLTDIWDTSPVLVANQIGLQTPTRSNPTPRTPISNRSQRPPSSMPPLEQITPVNDLVALQILQDKAQSLPTTPASRQLIANLENTAPVDLPLLQIENALENWDQLYQNLENTLTSPEEIIETEIATAVDLRASIVEISSNSQFDGTDVLINPEIPRENLKSLTSQLHSIQNQIISIPPPTPEIENIQTLIRKTPPNKLFKLLNNIVLPSQSNTESIINLLAHFESIIRRKSNWNVGYAPYAAYYTKMWSHFSGNSIESERIQFTNPRLDVKSLQEQNEAFHQPLTRQYHKGKHIPRDKLDEVYANRYKSFPVHQLKFQEIHLPVVDLSVKDPLIGNVSESQYWKEHKKGKVSSLNGEVFWNYDKLSESQKPVFLKYLLTQAFKNLTDHAARNYFLLLRRELENDTQDKLDEIMKSLKINSNGQYYAGLGFVKKTLKERLNLLDYVNLENLLEDFIHLLYLDDFVEIEWFWRRVSDKALNPEWKTILIDIEDELRFKNGTWKSQQPGAYNPLDSPIITDPPKLRERRKRHFTPPPSVELLNAMSPPLAPYSPAQRLSISPIEIDDPELSNALGSLLKIPKKTNQTKVTKAPVQRNSPVTTSTTTEFFTNLISAPVRSKRIKKPRILFTPKK